MAAEVKEEDEGLSFEMMGSDLLDAIVNCPIDNATSEQHLRWGVLTQLLHHQPLGLSADKLAGMVLEVSDAIMTGTRIKAVK